MRQGVVIAVALGGKPPPIIAGEANTAPDVSTQAQIIALLKKLCRDHGMAVMLITHDIGVIAETPDPVALMYAGRIPQIGPPRDILKQPPHPPPAGPMGPIPPLSGPTQRLAQTAGATPR